MTTIKKNPNFEREMKNKIERGLNRAAITLQAEVKSQLSGSSPAPRGQPPGVVTGALRRSIQVDSSDIGKGKVRVGTNLVYGAAQEYGHPSNPTISPHPYLRPSLKKSKREMLEQFKKG